MVIISIFILLHLVSNMLLSREIHDWIPAAGERAGYYGLLWLVPVVGIVLVWRRVRPDWFLRENGKTPSVSSGLLALDSIFNPGSVHVLDARKRSEVTIRMEGEMYDRELPDFVEIEDNAPTEVEAGTGRKD